MINIYIYNIYIYIYIYIFALGKLQISNAFDTSQLLINPPIEESAALKEMWVILTLESLYVALLEFTTQFL